MIKKIMFKFFKHDLLQTRFGRKLHGGSFYYMQTALPMAAFWSNTCFTSCQATCLKHERY